VFLGDFSEEKIRWDDVGRHVGWAVRQERTVDALRELNGHYNVAGVFVDCPNDGLCDVLRLKRIQAAAPDACLVVCRPLQLMKTTESDAVGAFHAIGRPLDPQELRQSVGFVWESWSRRNVERRHAMSAGAANLKYSRIA
jgi:hypothetical protein